MLTKFTSLALFAALFGVAGLAQAQDSAAKCARLWDAKQFAEWIAERLAK